MTTFNKLTAAYMALASHAAYTNDSYLFKEQLCLNEAIMFIGEGHVAYIGSDDDKTIICFRGTKNISDFLTDIEVKQISCPEYGGSVHEGFANEVEAFWPWLVEHTPKNKPVWITGHSEGSALAVLINLRLANNSFKTQYLYTFGCPRVGNKEFANNYKQTQFRFVHNNDLITRIPSIGYQHVGEEIYIGNIGKIQEIWGMTCGFFSLQWDKVFHQSLADHHMGNYLAHLNNSLPEKLINYYHCSRCNFPTIAK